MFQIIEFIPFICKLKDEATSTVRKSKEETKKDKESEKKMEEEKCSDEEEEEEIEGKDTRSHKAKVRAE